MKKCIKCNIDKELFNFHKNCRMKDGHLNSCKTCCKLYGKSHYIKNKNVILTRSKKFYTNNKENVLKYAKSYRESNRDTINSKQRNIYKADKKNRISKVRNRIKNNPILRFTHGIRICINSSLRKKSVSKKSRTASILGIPVELFIKYIESKFQPWMNWENYGKYNGEFNNGWDLDHIIPISSAKTEEEVIQLNYYTNIQPLCSRVNRCVKRANKYFQ